MGVEVFVWGVLTSDGLMTCPWPRENAGVLVVPVDLPHSNYVHNMAASAIDGAEVTKHHTRESCWVVLHGKVWDVTGKAKPGVVVILLQLPY